MANLTEKVALVSGGSRGIGAAIAKRLAEDGASVAITYAKGAGAASDVVKAIEAAGGKAIAIQPKPRIRKRPGQRLKRPLQPSAGLMCLSTTPAWPSRNRSKTPAWKRWIE